MKKNAKKVKKKLSFMGGKSALKLMYLLRVSKEIRGLLINSKLGPHPVNLHDQTPF